MHFPATPTSCSDKYFISPQQHLLFTCCQVIKVNLSLFTCFIPTSLRDSLCALQHSAKHWLLSRMHQGYRCETIVTWKTKPHHSIISLQRIHFVSVGLRNNKDSLVAKLRGLSFINHAAKAADYMCNNQCDSLNRKKRANEKWKLPSSFRDRYP